MAAREASLRVKRIARKQSGKIGGREVMPLRLVISTVAACKVAATQPHADHRTLRRITWHCVVEQGVKNDAQELRNRPWSPPHPSDRRELQNEHAQLREALKGKAGILEWIALQIHHIA